jgi:hypothetical protein
MQSKHGPVNVRGFSTTVNLGDALMNYRCHRVLDWKPEVSLRRPGLNLLPKGTAMTRTISLLALVVSVLSTTEVQAQGYNNQSHRRRGAGGSCAGSSLSVGPLRG